MEILDASSILIAITAIVVSICNSASQRRFNKLSVRPLPTLSYSHHLTDDGGELSSSISVKLWNVGNGPLVVDKLVICDKNSNAEYLNGFDVVAFSEIETASKYYVHRLHGDDFSVLGRDSYIVLLSVDYDSESAKTYECFRKRLANLEIQIFYSDLYGDKFDKKMGMIHFH